MFVAWVPNARKRKVLADCDNSEREEENFRCRTAIVIDTQNNKVRIDYVAL